MIRSNLLPIKSNWNGQLVECQLDGISFPVIAVDLSVDHDLSLHKKPSVPGANVENTGRNPIKMKVKAAFYNNLTKASFETWDPNNLYPNTFVKVFNRLLDTKAFVFQHPTLGTYNMMAVSGSCNISADHRNGQELDFELIEANQDEFNTAFFNKTIVAGVDVQSAAILDGHIAGVFVPQPDKLSNGRPFSFASAMNLVKASIDQTSLAIEKAYGKVNNVLYKISQVEGACRMLEQQVSKPNSVTKTQFQTIGNPFTFFTPKSGLIANPAMTANILVYANRVKGSCFNQIAGMKNQGNFINFGVYKVQAPTTIGALSVVLNCSVADLVKFNPQLITSSVISVGAQVVYKTQKASGAGIGSV